MRKIYLLLAILLVSCEIPPPPAPALPKQEADILNANFKATWSDIAALKKQNEAQDSAIVSLEADLANLHGYLADKNKNQFVPKSVAPMPEQ